MRDNRISERLAIIQDTNTPHLCDYRYICKLTLSYMQFSVNLLTLFLSIMLPAYTAIDHHLEQLPK
jgi:hypothetical protein